MSAFADRPAAAGIGLLLAALCSSVAPLSAQTNQLISCRRSVIAQHPEFGTRVSVTPAGRDAQGNHMISWFTSYQASEGAKGTCLVDQSARVLRVDVASQPPTVGPQPQPVVPGSSRLICESQEARRKECAIPSDRQVRLVRTISNNPCIETKSWGTTAGAIWVTAGCRGEFELTSRPVVDPGFGGGSTRQITCGSLGGNQVQCKTLGYATNVRLVRDLSGRCRQNSTWGHTDSFIWANSGCRALFEVSYRNTVQPQPPTPPVQTTRRIMCGNANNTQAQCPTMGQATDVVLVRNYGSSLCRQNTNWGHTGSSIWTNGGCRAEFEVTFNNAGPVPVTPPPTGTRTMTCGNAAGSNMSCNPMGRVSNVRLVRDYTGGGCRQGSTWGFTQDDLWVRSGCYGQFAVSYVGVPQPR